MNDSKDLTITGLDEETAFDPSEFFENEEVEATFDEVIEAIEESSDAEEPSFDPMDYFIEEDIDKTEEVLVVSKANHPIPTAEEDEAIVNEIFEVIDIHEITQEEIEYRQATELANRFGFNFETDKPCMFDHRGIDFKVDKKLLTLAALRMFFVKNVYTEENLPSPQVLGQAFRDWLVEVLKVYNKEAEYQIKGFYELQPEAIAGLIAVYENVAMFEFLDDSGNVVSKQLCMYVFDKYEYAYISVSRNNFERLIGMYEPKVKKHQVSKVISLLKKMAKTLTIDNGYDKEKHESFFKPFTYRALVKRLENPTQKEIAKLDGWLD